MQPIEYHVETGHYAKTIEGSKQIRLDIDKDVIRGREFDFSKKFLPDGISKIDQLDFLNKDESRILSQIQGRTYANMFGFVERFITVKIFEITQNQWLDDEVAIEAFVRFCDEELKHQELFWKIERMMANNMPEGYRFIWDANEIAASVLQKSTWAVMMFIYEIELSTQEHYIQSIKPDKNVSELFKDVFLFRWEEEAHHTYLDELEWPRKNMELTSAERDQAIAQVIEFVGAVDKILQVQSKTDGEYFFKVCKRTFTKEEIDRIEACLLKAYRWQYIFSGVEHPLYQKLLQTLITESQHTYINQALAPLAKAS
jgi:hypothetical protein